MGRALGAAGCAREAGEGGVCPRVCAVAGGGCAMYAGAEAGLGPRPSGVWWKDRGRTRERAEAGPALLPRVEKLLVVPAGRSSLLPVLSVSDQYNLPPKPVGADCVPQTLVPAVILEKKKSF